MGLNNIFEFCILTWRGDGPTNIGLTLQKKLQKLSLIDATASKTICKWTTHNVCYAEKRTKGNSVLLQSSLRTL